MKDMLFKSPHPIRGDFAFGRDAAGVFEDMLARSIPFYGEIQAMTAELARSFAQEGSAIYDLGCSTGTTMLSDSGGSANTLLGGAGADAATEIYSRRGRRAFWIGNSARRARLERAPAVAHDEPAWFGRQRLRRNCESGSRQPGGG